MNICSGICSDCETPSKCIHIFVRPCFRSASVWSRRGGGSRNRRSSWKDRESWRGRGRRRDAKRLRGERQADGHESRHVSFVKTLRCPFSTKPNCSTRTLFANVQAAKRELERQRQLEWERQRRQELLTQRNREQESIVLLKARKKTLEFELEALVIHRQQTQSHVIAT